MIKSRIFEERRETPLILGATGFLGSHLLQEVIYETSWPIYVQARSLDKAIKLASKYEQQTSRLKIVKGDVTHPGIVNSFSQGDLDEYLRSHHHTHIPSNIIRDPTRIGEMKENLTLILNGAGNVNFGDTIEKLMAVNADSTVNALELAASCPKLRIYGHVGTAYTNPIGNGRIMEADFFDSPNPEASGGNYAFSKTKGKKLILEAMKRKHPFAVDLYEPSIIIGHSGNGQTGEDNMTFNSYLYGLIRGLRKSVFNSNLQKLMEAIENYNPKVDLRALGYETTTKSFICVDEVARRILRLSTRPNPQSSVFHVTGEPLSGLQVGKAINNILPFLRMRYVGDRVQNPSRVEALVGKLTSHLDYYVTHSDDFDTTRADEVYDQVGYSPFRMDLSMFTAVNARYVDKLLRGLEKKEKQNPQNN